MDFNLEIHPHDQKKGFKASVNLLYLLFKRRMSRPCSGQDCAIFPLTTPRCLLLNWTQKNITEEEQPEGIKKCTRLVGTLRISYQRDHSQDETLTRGKDTEWRIERQGSLSLTAFTLLKASGQEGPAIANHPCPGTGSQK